MKKILFCISTLLFCTVFSAFAQENQLIADYQSQSQYWKNKIPTPGYWQQDVHYKIAATIDIQTHTISGQLDLFYLNNSPDTLKEVFFHLYQNAFQPNSHYHNLQQNNHYEPYFSRSEKQGLGIQVENINSSNEVKKVTYDNTLVKIELSNPILPNEGAIFNLEFKTYYGFGSTRRRMNAFKTESEFLHYNGTQWYPKIAVYDQKFGWNTNQHLDKEFYGDFGTFEVSLSFPSNYIVEATGILQNEQEVLPEDLKAKIQLKNFKHRGDGSEADTLSIPVPFEKDKFKTWKYKASFVHDFAFTADPTYRIEEIEEEGIKYVAIVQEENAPKWQNAASYNQKIVQTFSKDFGKYEYPKMVVADARDGMEYPMLTLDHGGDPGYRGLLVHEIGHNWFYGMLGSNETYRACMDEGFTQFITAWGLEAIDGDTLQQSIYKGSDPYYKAFVQPQLAREYKVMLPYTIDALKNEDARLNKHSSDYQTALRQGGGYRSVYHKTAAMLYNLQYVLGDELFLAAMKNYVNQWKFAHPYPEDFKNSVIRFTKVDLNWFFDQWLETKKSIDYSIKHVRRGNQPGEYLITFERIGQMEMPIDFQIIDLKDSIHNFHIPNKWFVKNTSATVLPKWYGWGKLHPNYTAEVYIPNGIGEVEIDTSLRLADINRLNNCSKLNYDIQFNGLRNPNLNRDAYQIFVRPDLWYSKYDGLKVGLNLNSFYLKTKHQIDASFWFNSGLFQNVDPSKISVNKYDPISFRVNYSNFLSKLGKNHYFNFFERFAYGLNTLKIGLEKRNGNNKWKIYAKSLYIPGMDGLNYQLQPGSWQHRKFNNHLNASFTHDYQYKNGNGTLKTKARGTFLSDYDYSYVNGEANNTTRLKKFVLKSRLFLQLGQGSNWAPESKLFFAGANPEKSIDNKYFATDGILSTNSFNYDGYLGNYQLGGGLNLRGFTSYLVPETNKNDSTIFAYSGASGAAVNLELEFDQYLGLNKTTLNKHFHFSSYFFYDVGVMNLGNDLKSIDLSKLRMDAGVGAAITLERIWRFQTVQPLTIRFDMPLYVNPAPFLAPENFAFRWVIGINRAF